MVQVMGLGATRRQIDRPAGGSVSRVLGAWLAVALVAAGTGAAVPEAATAVQTSANSPFGTSAADVDECPAELATVEEAARVALACGTSPLVTETMTEWATGRVTESNDLVMEYAASAVRQDSDGVDGAGDGQWAPVDVQVGSEPVGSGALAGMLPVTGGVEPIWLNPGGSAGAGLPLAVIGEPSERVRMYSQSLPVVAAGPAIVGDTRVAYEFGGGVTMSVSVSDEGTSVVPVVRVADREALEHLSEDLINDATSGAPLALSFPLDLAPGLDLAEAEAGFAIRDAGGELAYESGPALQWDSAGAVDWSGDGTDSGSGQVAEPDPAVDGAGDETDDDAAGVRQDAVEASPSTLTATSWDAAATAADETDGKLDRVDAPASGDVSTAMDVQVSGDTVTVVPDQAMLADASTRFPVSFDPRIGASTPSSWAMVQTYAPWRDTPHYKFAGDEGVGRCDPAGSTQCTVVNTQRILWHFGGLQAENGTWLGNLEGSDIIDATLSARGVFGYDCAARSVDAYGVDNYLTSSTVYDTVQWGAHQDRWSGTHRATCSGYEARAEWSVSDRVRTAANDDLSWIVVAIRAADESSMNWWKRYVGNSATLTIRYDRPPVPPTASQTKIKIGAGETELSCEGWDNRVQVRTTTPILTARSSGDPDGTSELQYRFRLERQTDYQPFWWSGWTTPAGAATWGSRTVPGAANLQKNATYRWRVQVRSTDPVTGSVKTTSFDDSPLCFFTVDKNEPNEPNITSTGTYKYRQVAGGVGIPIEVRISSNGSTDVVAYEWSFNNQRLDEPAKRPSSPGGSVLASKPVTRSGLNYIAARSVDDAGLKSDVTIYEFYVGFAQTTAHWQFNDAGWATNNPRTAANSQGGSTAGGLALGSGVTWQAGATQPGLPGRDPALDGLYPPSLVSGSDPASRVADGSLVFDSPTDVATSTPAVVDGDQSYTVSAFLRADDLTGADDIPDAGAAVSQVPMAAESVDGDYRSSFHLGYSVSGACPSPGQVPCWSFWHVRENDPSSGTVTSRTAVPVVEGQWVHVVGVYNATAKTVQAWACPVYVDALDHKRPEVGKPDTFLIEDGNPTTWSPWNVAGNLRLGSGMKNGSPLWPFRGAIDEVRIADGTIYDEAKLDNICLGSDIP